MHVLLSCSSKTILKGWAVIFLVIFSLWSFSPWKKAMLIVQLTISNSSEDLWNENQACFFVVFVVMSTNSSCNLPFSPLIDLLWLFLACIFFQTNLWFVCVYTNSSPSACRGTFPSTINSCLTCLIIIIFRFLAPNITECTLVNLHRKAIHQKGG